METDTEIGNNMEEDLRKAMQIRYIKLHFELEITEDGHLPKYKASALRGGMGQMLLMMNCIRDGKCDGCDFIGECIVPRVTYPKMKVSLPFMTQNVCEGYVIECEDYEQEYFAGDTLAFHLLLFGDSIVYFNQYVQAFHALGMVGLGEEHLTFRLLRVTNTNREVLLEDGIFYKERYRVRRLEEYVRYRLRSYAEGGEVMLRFHTPLTLKFQGEFLQHFDPEPLLVSAARRLVIMNAYEGLREGEDYPRIDSTLFVPKKEEERVFREAVPRYSGTQDRKMVLRGITGSCQLTGVSREAFALLATGELLHIGKNTRFGFGRYTIKTT